MIKEVTTCSYLMVVYTPRLCNDAAFLPPRADKVNPIACREVVASSDLESWKKEKTAEAVQMFQEPVDVESELPKPIYVGGIEVGGKKFIGTSGGKIEGGIIVKSGKVEVVAKGSPGKGEVLTMPDEELRKLKLDPKTVKELRDKLKHMAKERGWKLEIVEEAGVTELRGIVESDDDYDLGPSANVVEEHKNDGEDDGAGEDDGKGSEETYKEEL
jgi:protein OS-9